MKIAITGGTGFVGWTLARALVAAGHEIVLVARGVDHRDPAALELPGSEFHPIGLDDTAALARAFAGGAAVAHCAGINREIGTQIITVFGLVGFRPQAVRPTAVEDVSRLLQAALVDGALSRRTVAVTGPEELTLAEAVRRVARVVGRRPLMLPLSLWFHYALAWCVERWMVIPLVSVAQVRILSEGLVQPWPPCEALPPELQPRLPFSEDQIRRGLPPARAFGLRDLRRHRGRPRAEAHRHAAFFELP